MAGWKTKKVVVRQPIFIVCYLRWAIRDTKSGGTRTVFGEQEERALQGLNGSVIVK